jgi:preprotein translocase subunit SecF
MELIKPGINIDFMGVRRRKVALAISAALVLASALIVAARGGPNYGIDFSGGVMVHLRFAQPKSVAEVRSALVAIDLGESNIQDYGTGGTEFLVRLPLEASAVANAADRVAGALRDEFGESSFELLRVEVVGPRVGAELRQRALLAVVFSTVMMGIYIWFRFEWRFAIGAALALMHDVIITIGALALFDYEFDLTIIAALLTVVGFSVNDTVIVSDRIRENMRKNRRETLEKVINRSINETLSRTVLTTGTAVLVILALYFLGGNVIHGFAFALLIGFTVGTYSSVYVASAIVLLLESFTSRRPQPAAVGTRRAAR